MRVGVGVALAVGVPLGVGVSVIVGVAVVVEVGASVAVGVSVAVSVAVGVGYVVEFAFFGVPLSGVPFASSPLRCAPSLLTQFESESDKLELTRSIE